ncbi:MAG: tRNA (N(6)-L-threonylcarbamoyladenosine(37)-C(2))-methylthiotransferase [Candidatus Kariarchaeaceae archaeon]|jgi:MiaB-like tRNA modifying enzyme
MNAQQAVVLTWGCTHNQKDSQLIEQQLINAGFSLGSENEVDSADIIILNTCTVKTPTEHKIFHVMDELKDSKQTIVVTGCISQASPTMIQKKYPKFIVMGVNAATRIVSALDQKNGDGILLPMVDTASNAKKSTWIDKPLLDSTQWNLHRNIVQINEGCVNSCSFCATKNARGHLRSFSRDSIVYAVRKTIAQEVWLTSQDTACWGLDLQDSLPNLLNDLDKIERKHWIRVGMGNPNNFIKILDEAIESYKSEKIYKFLHLPVQSGNNQVLQHMRRGYTVEDYECIVQAFRKAIPEITLSTDVITGYPTESASDFEDTLKTIKNTRPSITNISRYWERNDTPAAGLKQLPFKERKIRSTALGKLCKQIQSEDNKKWVGWKGEILLIERGPKGGIEGRNIAYKPIIVNTTEEKLGTWQKVKIIEAKSTHFTGELIL